MMRSSRHAERSAVRFRDTERGKAWNRNYNRNWRLAHPYYWRRRAWKRMGLDPDAAQVMYDATNNCSVCGSRIAGYKKHIDHSHSTSTLRGVLCNECNQAIGHMHEDTVVMARAIDYLLARPRKNGWEES